MENILPSKRILYVLIPALIIISIALYLALKPTWAQKNQFSVVNKELTGIDSDSDELKDWEEELWGTDLYNPDTDGDGTKDGEEVKNNRHPRVQGPDDTITEEHKDLLYDSADAYLASANLTEELQNSVMAETLTLAYENVSGEKVSQGNIEMITSQIQSELSKVPETIFYTQNDISITQNPSTNSYRQYLAQIILLMDKQNTVFSTDDPITLVTEALEKDSNKPLEELKTVSMFYDRAAKTLLAVPVPYDVAQEHVDILNAMKSLSNATYNMQFVLDDPVRGIQAVNQYESSIVITNTVATALGKKLSNKLR